MTQSVTHDFSAESYCPACQTALPGNVAECPNCGRKRATQGWPVDALLGKTVVGDQYRVLSRLGEGGFGAVYEVETVVGGLRRALKVLGSQWSADCEVRDRFVNEALILEQLNHPNIARCYAVGTLGEGGELYLLLELIHGVDIEQLLVDEAGAGRKPLQPARAVRLARQIASALAVAHAKGILHRDLKPGNVLVTRPGSSVEQVKILDFGIAKLLGEGGSATSNIVGTPRFMAPEQLQPGSPLDARLDLWQLGALLYFMLTGHAPYELPQGEWVMALTRLHASHRDAGPMPSAEGFDLGVDSVLDQLVGRLLASDPERRPSSAAEVVDELARVEHLLTPGAAASSPLALLKTICADPSDGGWWALCRYLESQGEDQIALVGATEQLLKAWPDELRKAPISWWESMRRTGAHPLWRLCRRLDLSSRGLTDQDIERLTGSVALESITELDLSDNLIGPAGAASLGASSHLGRLSRLDLSFNRLGSAGLTSLTECEALASLKALGLAENGIGQRGVTALIEAGWELIELDLRGNDIGADGARALGHSDSLSKLRHLRLDGNRIGSDGAAALAASPQLTGVQALDLGNNGIGPAGAAALAVSTYIGNLVRLGLARNDLGREGLELLASSRGLDSLEDFDLSGNGIGASGAMLLAAAPVSRRFRNLDISDNGLGDAGLAGLLGAPHLAALRGLSVAGNKVTSAGAALLSGAMPQLAELDISDNPLDDSGAEALASALARMRISTLRARNCGFTGEGVVALLRAGAGRLQHVDLGRNPLRAKGVEALARARELSSVERLDLSETECGAGGGRALTESPNLSCLRYLELNSNQLGDEGARALADGARAFPRLESLSLADNRLGVRAAAALAASPIAAHLSMLDLSYNPLGDAGIEAVAQYPGWHSLRELRLVDTDLSMSGAAIVMTAPGTSLLYRLQISRNAIAGQVDMHSLNRDVISRMESTFGVISSAGADFSEQFYAELFNRMPSVKPLFAATNMRRQKDHLMAALSFVIENLRHPDVVEGALLEMGRRHVGYGVSPSHYYGLTRVLVNVMSEFAGEAWTETDRQAWLDGLDAVAAVMLRAHHERMEADTEAFPEEGGTAAVDGSGPDRPTTST